MNNDARCWEPLIPDHVCFRETLILESHVQLFEIYFVKIYLNLSGQFYNMISAS